MGEGHRSPILMVCSACRKTVGYWAIGQDMTPVIEGDAGWVLERWRPSRMSICRIDHLHAGQGAVSESHSEAHREHPLVCSDACEDRILADPTWHRCDPPPDYQRY
jgi:hypothetical protein